MAQPNEVCDTIMRELNDLVLSDNDESKEQQSFSFHEEAGFDDIPPSLLSYFETSKSRAAVCEKLILEDLEDFTVSHHPEDVRNLSMGLDKDMMKLNEQVICDPENEENDISTDTRRLASTETETLSDRLCTHNMPLCSNNEDEAGTNMESEEHLLFETRTLDILLNGKERKKMSEYEEERKKQQYEEMKLEEHKRQIERDFQEELRKIMEAEKLHQKEIELMEKRAQEKLEQEFLLQQELISNLQRRVKKERRMREEEQNRMKRKKEEEKVKMEAERKRMEEERKMREDEATRKREEEKVKKEAERKTKEEERRTMEEEDKRKREEEKVKMEAERKRKEEERKMMEEEDKRKREEEKVKKEAERKRQEEERRIMEEEQRRMKEEVDKRKREEEKVKMEAERKRKEEETRRKKEEEMIIEEMKLKKEKEERRRMEREEKWREEERIKIDLERRKLENEVRMTQEEQKKERTEEVERKKEEEEKRKRGEEEGNKIEETTKVMEKMETERKIVIEIRLKKEDECRKRKERKDKEGRVTKEIEERKEQVGVTEKKKEAGDRKKMAQEKMDEEMRNGDKNGNIDEEIKLERKKSEEMYRKRLEEEKDRKNMEEEKDSKEVVRNQEGENRKIKERRPIVEDEKKNTDVRKTEEEERGSRQTGKMRKPRDEDNYRKSEEDDLDNRRMAHESKTKDEQKREEEKRNKDEGRKNIESEKEQNGNNVEENKEEVNKTMGEEMRIKEKKKSKNRMMLVWGKEVKVIKAHELQEKREEHSMKGHNEKKHIDKSENSSPREDSTSWSSSSLQSIICPDGTEAIPQHQDLDKKISQTSARPTTGSVSLPVCLPEHTEQRRLSWMKDCIPWSKLSLQNRRKQKGSVRSRRGLRRAAEASSLPPLCPDSLLQSTGWKSLQEVTTVTLEDLPGCSLSTLAQCTQLQSLSLRRCGLKSLEGINHLPQLCYIDVQENDISFTNCENMICLRVLKLGHNKLTSIHGLAGAENLDVLHLSHNSITRIAGLESVRSLQRLSVDHNQLISTKGLRDVYTLLHLNCSHNHLAGVEGLENSALLNTLDLRANSLTEPPSLNNQVLLRELHLDDNSISSLQSLTACWLPLLQHLSVAQNRITQLPFISDFVSLENLDLRFNCMSELQTVCESLEGCHLLQKVHLTGNPLQQESGWRSTLQKAVPGLQVIDDQWTDSSLSPPAAQQVTLASGSFLAFCQTQLQQTHDLLQQHNRELSKASSSLDAVNVSCQHFTEALQLAADQRFAHEYGDANVADKHRVAGQTIPEETVDMGSANADKHSECPEIDSTEKIPPVIPISDNIGYLTLDEKSAAESRHDTFDTDTTRPRTEPAVSKVNSGSVNSLVTKRKTNPTNLKMAPVFNRQDLDRQIAAAVVIQQLWRKYRKKCGNISSPSTAEKRGGRGGDGVKPGPGPSYINGSVVGQDHAATVIQAFWRGFTLRRRLASALAAVTCSDSGEDDTFEEVDMDEFVFDEAALEKHWSLPLCEDSPLRRYPVSEQPLSLKPTWPFPEPSQYILPPTVERKSKQAWVAPEQVDSERQGVSPLSSNRSKSLSSSSVVSGLLKRSEKIREEWGFTNHHTALLMLKRAQNMKSKKHQQKRRREPSVRLALFRNCDFQPHPVEARNRKARHSSNDINVRDVELGLQQAERTERVKQDQARQWLHSQAAHSGRDSESECFLPEISSDILNGGRVQLVADPGYTERLHHASGLWASSSLTAQPCRENNYPRRNSLGHARKEVPSPRGATSASSIRERISFRDNPVQLSGGWGGGKKRGKVYK